MQTESITKQCPICGSKVVIESRYINGSYQFRIRCTSCGSRQVVFSLTVAAALNKFNKEIGEYHA